MRVGSCQFNSFAYADDITVFSTSASGLQQLIDLCAKYAKEWRFKFGIKKTKCMMTCGEKLGGIPEWKLNGEVIETVPNVEILGMDFEKRGGCALHVSKRVDKCRRSFYSLKDIGMAYPECDARVKGCLWNTMCRPVLLYGMECYDVSEPSLSRLETSQGNLVKQSLGLCKRSRSSALLKSMKIDKIRDSLVSMSSSLIHRVFAVESPLRVLTMYYMSLFLKHGTLLSCTLMDRLVSYNLSPVKCAFTVVKPVSSSDNDGIVDSLRTLLFHENFVKPYSEEHILSVMLTRSF